MLTGMTAFDNLRGRQLVISALILAVDNRDRVLEICATTDGDVSHVRAALVREFKLDPMQADAILGMQVRQFTPRVIALMRVELAEVEAELRA
jgi:DNA gyrase/topoisomerase IV subunit A